ncbi:hypothetical protein T440DRAFT_281935 [Plenodomus tracheiphilus IPT5]|uniref:Uncharacterized protein n=1 Tax=Plenodomus tracheiphilus IPT5 TaxID=1408161 RepID=A0A6A7APU1_9PLEO|nr:hypothetical protein T440DRAFT_281935 [Plenodomus tracheiphilus IPT5]
MRLCTTENLGLRLRMLPGQTAKASSGRGGRWDTERARQVHWTGRKGSNSREAAATGWQEGICKRQPNPRHHLGEEEFGERRRAGARRPGGMQDGSFAKPREDLALGRTVLPWAWRRLSEAGQERVRMNRGQSMRRRWVAGGRQVALRQRRAVRRRTGPGRAMQQETRSQRRRRWRRGADLGGEGSEDERRRAKTSTGQQRGAQRR